MAMKIDMDKPLSPEARQYLLDRGRADQVEANEAKHGKQSGLSRAQRDERIVELRAELERLEHENAREDNPNVANPLAGIGGGVQDNTVVDGQRPEGAPEAQSDDYEDGKKWTAGSLREEVVRRNEERVKDNLEPLATTGSKAELIERLRRDDKEIQEAQ